jgi:hypothetical protein
MEEHGIRDMPNMHVMYEDPFHLVDSTDPRYMVEDFKALLGDEKLRLIVIDTYARALGSAHENDTRDTSVAVQSLDMMRRAFGCASLVVHHTGKDKSKGSRGNNVLPASTICLMEVTMEESKVTGKKFVTLTCERLKGPTFSPASFELVQVELPDREDEEDMGYLDTTSCVLRPAPDYKKNEKKTSKVAGDGLTENDRKVLSFLGSATNARHADIAKGTLVKGSSLTRSLKKLEERNLIQVATHPGRDGGNDITIYALIRESTEAA